MRKSLISICGFLLLSSGVVLAGSWTLPRSVTAVDFRELRRAPAEAGLGNR
jgi:hypothetical protein